MSGDRKRANIATASTLHRHGIARVLSSTSNNMNRRASAYVETCGPKFLAARLAKWRIRNDVVIRPFDLDSVSVSAVEHIGRWRYRFVLTYTRL